MFNYGYRQGNWVLLPPSRQKENWQLYNVKEDPAQQHNLAKEEPKRIAKMTKRFEELTQETGKVTKSFNYQKK